MKEPIKIPKAKSLEFLPLKEWPEGQCCLVCNRPFKSILARPRYAQIDLNKKQAYRIVACSEKCTKIFKTHQNSDKHIKDSIMLAFQIETTHVDFQISNKPIFDRRKHG